MQFSPLLITPLILEPLRYFFSEYSGDSELRWHEDEKKRTVEISDMHDFHKIPFQERPRILVDRGGYQVGKVGLSDNLAEGDPLGRNAGLRRDINMLFYSGVANMIIEARHKGTCELLTDMATHFLAWSRPLICDTQGFKQFADSMSVSSCAPTGDQDDTTFQVSVQIPYLREEQWVMRNDGLKLKAYLSQVFPV